jgi:ketosteroid isomerase-like protein
MEPNEFIKNYEAALATQDWEKVSPLIHRDACVTFSNGQTFRGKRAVQSAFEQNFTLIQDEHYAITNLHWAKKTADFAVCLYTFHWSGLIHDEPVSGSGRGTSVIVKQGGNWLLLAEHLGPIAK